MHNNEFGLVRLNVQPTKRLAAQYCWLAHAIYMNIRCNTENRKEKKRRDEKRREEKKTEEWRWTIDYLNCIALNWIYIFLYLNKETEIPLRKFSHRKKWKNTLIRHFFTQNTKNRANSLKKRTLTNYLEIIILYPSTDRLSFSI